MHMSQPKERITKACQCGNISVSGVCVNLSCNNNNINNNKSNVRVAVTKEALRRIRLEAEEGDRLGFGANQQQLLQIRHGAISIRYTQKMYCSKVKGSLYQIHCVHCGSVLDIHIGLGAVYSQFSSSPSFSVNCNSASSNNDHNDNSNNNSVGNVSDCGCNEFDGSVSNNVMCGQRSTSDDDLTRTRSIFPVLCNFIRIEQNRAIDTYDIDANCGEENEEVAVDHTIGNTNEIDDCGMMQNYSMRYSPMSYHNSSFFNNDNNNYNNKEENEDDDFRLMFSNTQDINKIVVGSFQASAVYLVDA